MYEVSLKTAETFHAYAQGEEPGVMISEALLEPSQ